MPPPAWKQSPEYIASNFNHPSPGPGSCGAWIWVLGATFLTTSWPVVQQRCDELCSGDDDRIQDIRSRKSPDLPLFNFQDLWASKCLLMLAGRDCWKVDLPGRTDSRSRDLWVRCDQNTSDLTSVSSTALQQHNPPAHPLELDVACRARICSGRGQNKVEEQLLGANSLLKLYNSDFHYLWDPSSLSAESHPSRNGEKVLFIIPASMSCNFACEKQMFKMLLFPVTVIPNLNWECQ